MSNRNPDLDEYFVDGCGRCDKFATDECKVREWKSDLHRLREIVLETGLEEEKKWHHPTYTLNGKNVVLIHTFNDYYAINFIKGSLLSDPKGILVQPTKNMQADRQMRFTEHGQVQKMRDTIRTYLFEAIDNEKQGKKVQYKKTSEYDFPEELTEKINSDPEFKNAWNNLTPGRQRGYLLHFSAPKKSETRTNRIDKSKERIIRGKGFNER